jgi:outer membrane receptor protein involved in Fe transport
MKSGIRCLLAAAIMLSANPPKLRAEVTMGAEEAFFGEIPVVVTASKKAETIDQAPATMYVYTREDIQRKGFKNISDILQTLPGFGVQTSIRDLTQLQQVRGIIGTDNERITIMINGHKIDMFAEPGHLTGPINLDNVDRVEVILGPGSVLYGAETLGAIVNLIIEEPKKGVILTAGTDDYYSGTAMTGEKFSEGDMLLSATGMKRGGWNGRKADNMNDGDRVGEMYPSYFLYGRSRIKDWTFQGTAYNERKPELNIWSQGHGTEGTFYNVMNIFSAQNKTQWTDKLSTTLDSSFDDKRFQRLLIQGTGESYDMTQRSYTNEGAVQFQSDKNYLQGGAKFTLRQNPGNYYFSSWNPATNTGTTPPALRSENIDIRELGFYLSDDYKISDKLKITAAARADETSLFNDRRFYFSPRLADIVDPIPLWTSKLMYNKATRFPAPWDTDMSPFTGAGNPLAPSWASSLPNVQKPETLSAYEWQNILHAGGHRLTIDWYYQRLNDYIAWASPFANVGDFKGTGVEVYAKGPIIQKTLEYTLGGSTANNHFKASSPLTAGGIATDPEGKLDGNAKFQGMAGLDCFVTPSISGSLMVRYLTGQTVRDQAWPPPTYSEVDTYYHYWNRAYLDAGVQWKNFLINNLAMRLSGQNIFDDTKDVSKNFDSSHMNPRGAFYALTLDYSWGKVQ